MSVTVVEHKGEEIIYIDYQGLDEGRMIENVRKAGAFIMEKGQDGGNLLTISNLAGSSFGLKFLTAAKEATQPCEPYVRKSAIFGLTGIKSTMLDIYNRAFEAEGIRPFPTEAEALDWLAS